MSKNYYIILGNGFTIDFLTHFKIDTSKINVSNLFDNGELVKWPGDEKAGFLSYRRCPNLWTLGARPTMNGQNSIALIEDIITCANILNKNTSRKTSSTYTNAYKELVPYLKSLFIYYNSIIDIDSLNINEWSWVKYLNKIHNDPNTNKIHIVTFNYDIFLERILKKINLNFSISNFEDDSHKIVIYKPHGSISFSYNVKKVKEAYVIDYKLDSNDGEIAEFNIEYETLSALNVINAIIPPAGDSNRLDYKWAKDIRESARNVAQSLTEKDELIICGISYWHVDRLEIDSILTSVNPDLAEIKVINPSPHNVFNAIITTLFDNVIFFKNAEPLV